MPVGAVAASQMICLRQTGVQFCSHPIGPVQDPVPGGEHRSARSVEQVRCASQAVALHDAGDDGPIAGMIGSWRETSLQRTTAARSRSRRAAKAVGPCSNWISGHAIEAVDVPDCPRCTSGRQGQHLVEVAIIQAPVIADADQVFAHQRLDCRWVEVGAEQFDVGAKRTRTGEVCLEPCDRHVGNGVQVIEFDSKVAGQLFFVGLFQRALVGWKKRPEGVVNEVEYEPCTVPPVAQCIQLMEPFNALLKGSFSTLFVDIFGPVTGQRGHNFHSVFCQKSRGVLLRRETQHGQIAAVDDVVAQLTCGNHQSTKGWMKLGCPPSDVHGPNARARPEDREQSVHRPFIHGFGPMGPRTHVAMPAHLIAALAKVEL